MYVRVRMCTVKWTMKARNKVRSMIYSLSIKKLYNECYYNFMYMYICYVFV